MNVYCVKGRIQFKTWIPGAIHAEDGFYEVSYRRLNREVECSSEQEAADKAIAQYRKDMVDQKWEWAEGSEPKVELVREITEAEMMRRIGAPTLFD